MKRPRALFLLLVILCAVGFAGGLIAFLASRLPPPSPPAVAVAKAADVSTVPLAIEISMPDGADRVLQRERTGHPCASGAPDMGCPAATPLRPVPVYLVRDDAGAMHAFIGRDPRNGCALEWRTELGIFYDVCHGSLYDRRGRIVGGPSPWNLNELAVDVRGPDIYIDPGRITTGCMPTVTCPRPPN